MTDTNLYQNNNFYLQEIGEIAVLWNKLKTDKEELFQTLKDLPRSDFQEIQNRNKGADGPVKSLRREIADNLLNSQPVSAEFIDQRIKEIELESGKRSFRSYDYFSILYPFFQVGLQFNVKKALAELANDIITKLKLDDTTKTYVQDFWGARGFGNDYAYLAIYNSTHRNRQTAKQFFININSAGLSYGLYDSLKLEFTQNEYTEINEHTIDTIVSFLEPLVEEIKEDEYSKANFLSLGVKNTRFYKLSHGELFTQEQIQECLDANIAVVHDGEKGVGQTPLLQYERFVNARKGDLFYSCWGNNQLLVIGQFIDDEVRDFSINIDANGWKERNYRIIQQVQIEESYRGIKKVWTPNDPSTFTEVPEVDYELINEIILRPYFQAELKQDKATPVPKNRVGVSSQKEIRMLDSEVSPKLDVKIVAQEFANIIDNLEDNKGQMLGVFGSWGRGKTFFVDCVKDEFKRAEGDKEDYINVTFNAWKYQETEAIWAYLYEIMLDTYHADGVKENASGFKKKFIARSRSFILNFKRKGYSKFFGIFFGFIASLIIAYAISSSVKLEFAEYLISAVGVIGLIQAYLLYRRYYQGIKEVLNDYSSRHSYRPILGLQAEIQEELILLIKHWLKEKDERRILLFVDDLDRCNEEKIIQIIDALRVMLDDEYLVKKLIIIVAVDELLLERAIKLKYHDFDVDKEKKNLVQEYMDKLFISGIKFPSLNKDEQAVILENYAVKGGILERKTVANTESKEPTINEVTPTDEVSGFVYPEPNLFQQKTVESEFFLLRSELEMLQRYSDEISTNVTPRGLRIYMYRYLLSKNLASTYMSTGTSYLLEDEVCNLLAKAIASRSSNSLFSVSEMEEMNSVENQKLKDFIPKLIEMVVPY